ncbi:MAG: phosphotransferase [Actinomycetota bacterium]|nr:phosphotransferase [Actinomycetota bacterium]
MPLDLNRDIISVEPIGIGGNSQVYKVICRDTNCYALKVYYRDPGDNRDRLGAEFTALDWLWHNQVSDVPRPIAADYEKGCALYEFIEGSTAAVSVLTNDDIDGAVIFLTKLEKLAHFSSDSRRLPLAAEACFSIKAILENINDRLARLRGHGQRGAIFADLDRFLENDFGHRLDDFTVWSIDKLDKAGLSFDLELDWRQRTLSPSDFGFHNAIKRDDGRLVFVDFEYFGWDDPAKMVVDLLLHPGMTLTDAQKQRFTKGIIQAFAHDPLLAGRIEIVYPLFGLKWCTILLNEFLPQHMRRRQFAGRVERQDESVLAEQLAKTKSFLRKISEEHERFPYIS